MKITRTCLFILKVALFSTGKQLWHIVNSQKKKTKIMLYATTSHKSIPQIRWHMQMSVGLLENRYAFSCYCVFIYMPKSFLIHGK